VKAAMLSSWGVRFVIATDSSLDRHDNQTYVTAIPEYVNTNRPNSYLSP
jgi:hypothetical protein